MSLEALFSQGYKPEVKAVGPVAVMLPPPCITTLVGLDVLPRRVQLDIYVWPKGQG